jgi:hypothetical protein
VHEIGFAVHGGVIMAILTAFSGSDAPYHTWYVLNCGGYRVALTSPHGQKRGVF